MAPPVRSIFRDTYFFHKKRFLFFSKIVDWSKFRYFPSEITPHLQKVFQVDRLSRSRDRFLGGALNGIRPFSPSSYSLLELLKIEKKRLFIRGGGRDSMYL